VVVMLCTARLSRSTEAVRYARIVSQHFKVTENGRAWIQATIPTEAANEDAAATVSLRFCATVAPHHFGYFTRSEEARPRLES
jgi:hypothetical protein